MLGLGRKRTNLHEKYDYPDHEPLFAPVELERFAEFEGERHEGLAAGDASLLDTPVADEGKRGPEALLPVGRRMSTIA